MKWISHKLCNASVVFALTGNLPVTLLTTVGAVLPDVMEGGIVPHRTVTHYPIVYALPLVALLPFYGKSFPAYALVWVVAGCLSHLFFDSLSKGGISVLQPFTKTKVALNLYVTQRFSEFCFVGLVVVVFNAISRARGFFGAGFFFHQVHSLFSSLKSVVLHHI